MIVVTPTDPIPRGEPTAYPVADLTMDGVVTSADLTAWTDVKAGGSSASAYGLDLDFDDYYGPGEADEDLFWESYDANLGLSGKGRVSTLGVGNRIGYAGYQWDQVARAYHVRYRVYLPEIGRWTRRDPLGYASSCSLFSYCASKCIQFTDPLGLHPGCPPFTYLDPETGKCRSVRDGCPPGFYYDPEKNQCIKGELPQPPVEIYSCDDTLPRGKLTFCTWDEDLLRLLEEQNRNRLVPGGRLVISCHANLRAPFTMRP
jgi:RHS repeat-associated protein